MSLKAGIKIKIEPADRTILNTDYYKYADPLPGAFVRPIPIQVSGSDRHFNDANPVYIDGTYYAKPPSEYTVDSSVSKVKYIITGGNTCSSSSCGNPTGASVTGIVDLTARRGGTLKLEFKEGGAPLRTAGDFAGKVISGSTQGGSSARLRIASSGGLYYDLAGAGGGGGVGGYRVGGQVGGGKAGMPATPAPIEWTRSEWEAGIQNWNSHAWHNYNSVPGVMSGPNPIYQFPGEDGDQYIPPNAPNSATGGVSNQSGGTYTDGGNAGMTGLQGNSWNLTYGQLSGSGSAGGGGAGYGFATGGTIPYDQNGRYQLSASGAGGGSYVNTEWHESVIVQSNGEPYPKIILLVAPEAPTITTSEETISSSGQITIHGTTNLGFSDGTISLWEGDYELGSVTKNSNNKGQNTWSGDNWSITFDAKGDNGDWPEGQSSHQINARITSTEFPGSHWDSVTSTINVDIDRIKPVVTISSSSGNDVLVAGATPTITFQISETPKSGSKLQSGDIVVTNGSLGALTEVSSQKYTAVLTPDENSTSSILIMVNENAIRDEVNFGNELALLNIAVDTKYPTVTLTADNTTLKASEKSSITITLSENPKNDLTIDDIAVLNSTGGTLSGTLSNFNKTSSQEYTVEFTPPDNAEDSATIKVVANTFQDSAGNPNTEGSTQISFNTVRPTVTMSASPSTLRRGQTSTVTMTLSEESGNFALEDITFPPEKGNLSSFTHNGSNTKIYTAQFTPAQDLVEDVILTINAGSFDGTTTGNSNAAGHVTIDVRTNSTTINAGQMINLDDYNTLSKGWVDQNIPIPTGVSQMLFQLYGGTAPSSFGGTGAKIEGTITNLLVKSNMKIKLFAGGSSGSGGRGGAAIELQTDNSPVAIAGGGGGFGRYSGQGFWKGGDAPSSTGQMSGGSSRTAFGSSNNGGAPNLTNLAAGGSGVGGGGGGGGGAGPGGPGSSPFGGGAGASFIGTNVSNSSIVKRTGSSANGLDPKIMIEMGPAKPTIDSVSIDHSSREVTLAGTGTDTSSNSKIQIYSQDETWLGETEDSKTNSNWSKKIQFTEDQTDLVIYAKQTTTILTHNLQSQNSDTQTITVDTTSPSVTITANPESGLKADETATITFALSEDSADFQKNDITVTGGELGDLVGSGRSYTATFTPASDSTANATITVQSGKFHDAAGNPNIASSRTITGINTKKPTVNISANYITIQAGGRSEMTFTFSEVPQSFEKNMITITSSDITNPEQYLTSPVRVSSKTYKATLTPPDNKTTNISLEVQGNKFEGETSRNMNSASSRITISIRTMIPTIQVTSSTNSLKFGQTATITFALSEESTDFQKDDITVTGGELGDLVRSGRNYSATFTPNTDSTVDGVISVPSDKFTNSEGNFNKDGSDDNNKVTIAVNTVRPTVTIDCDVNITKQTKILLTFNLSEPTADFQAGDINVTPPTGSIVANSFNEVSNNTYTAELQFGSEVAYTVSVNADKFTGETSGNPNVQSNSLQIIYDKTAPVISNPKNGQTQRYPVGTTEASIKSQLESGMKNDENLPLNSLITPSFQANTVDEYTFSYSVSDAAGNSSANIVIPVNIVPKTPTLSRSCLIVSIGNYLSSNSYTITPDPVIALKDGKFKGDWGTTYKVSATKDGLTSDQGTIVLPEEVFPHSCGDPYIQSANGMVTKIPDKHGFYRMFQHKDIFINTEVEYLNVEKELKAFLEMVGCGFNARDGKLPVSVGYWTKSLFIQSEGHSFSYNMFENALNKSTNYFTIKDNGQGRRVAHEMSLDDDLKKSIVVSWNHSVFGKQEVVLDWYHNPQVQNGISLRSSLISDKQSSGLFIKNYKAKYMELDSLETGESKKLSNKIKKAKRNGKKLTHERPIKSESEDWYVWNRKELLKNHTN